MFLNAFHLIRFSINDPLKSYGEKIVLKILQLELSVQNFRTFTIVLFSEKTDVPPPNILKFDQFSFAMILKSKAS